VQEPEEPHDHDPAAIRIRFRRAALTLAAGALVAVPSGRAGQVAVLPSPFVPVRPTPPLPALAVVSETRFPGRLSSTQAVRVVVDSSGRPIRVVDVDRVAVTRKGDYSFVIAGPIEDVSAAAGSESEPGLRTGAVVWQGFSLGRRRLAAAIRLRAGTAAGTLPLRIEVKGSTLELINATSARTATIDARLPADGLARILDAAVAALRTDRAIPAPPVQATGPIRDVHVLAHVPLRVRGTVRFDGRPPQRIDAVVGGKPVRLDAKGDLEALELSVSVPDPSSVLRPTGARSWLELARAGRLPPGRKATRLAVNRLLSAALAGQFREFLANPDASGSTETSYRYELARRAAVSPPEQQDAGNGWLVPLGVGLGLAALAAGAIVLWAHS
jgi:hypothetical protein